MVRATYVAQFVLYDFATLKMQGGSGSVVVKALCYKPEGRGFNSR
jgi:hypothetical protein